jgi:hypothetical protein
MTQISENLRFIGDFGGIDASEDKVLLAAFEDHDSYNWAMNFAKPFIIGRKGSGKSAVYQKITKEPKGNAKSIGFTFADYPWQHHAKQKQIGVPDEECYRESWKYFICLMFCKLLLKTRDSIPQDSSATEALDTIEAFLRDSYGSLNPNLSKIFTPGQQIKISGKLSVFGVGGEVGTIPVEHLPKFYSEINQNIIACILKCVPRNIKYYICFDELDIGFEPENVDYLRRLIGLIRAARYVNQQCLQADLQAGVIVLLRDDIWHTLRFEDKNKITQGHLSEIKWSQGDGPHCLKRLMERRFGEVLGKDHVSWDDVFNETKTMAQFKSKYDYICRRTFLRPRDLIQFSNKILEAFKLAPSDAGFEAEHVKNAEKNYSAYFMQELEDELHKHSASYDRYFDVLKSLINVSFTLDEFESAWQSKRAQFNADENPEQALKALFEFSVVGFLAAGGHGAGSKYVWRYLDPKTKFNSMARNFQVHMGLKEEFELKLYSRKKAAG